MAEIRIIIIYTYRNKHVKAVNMSINVNFNPTVKLAKLDPADYQIRKKLEELGINPTGSKEGDLEAIRQATGKSGTEAAQGNKPAAQTPPEIASFMKSIGATPTNSKEGDELAVRTRLQQMETQAATPADKSRVEGYKAEWAALTASAAPQSAGAQQNTGTGDAFAGQSQLAKMNRHFLVK